MPLRRGHSTSIVITAVALWEQTGRAAQESPLVSGNMYASAVCETKGVAGSRDDYSFKY
jgi:hypothetical protein